MPCVTPCGVVRPNLNKSMRNQDVEEREENIDVEEREKERERGSNLRRQRLASPTARVLVAQTTRPVHVPAECSERLTPGQSSLLGAAAIGSIPALALSLFLQQWETRHTRVKHRDESNSFGERTKDTEKWDTEAKMHAQFTRALWFPGRVAYCTSVSHDCVIWTVDSRQGKEDRIVVSDTNGPELFCLPLT